MHRMFSACASADNTVNNPALLLICAKTLFELSSFNLNFWILKVRLIKIGERACIYKMWIVSPDSVDAWFKGIQLDDVKEHRCDFFHCFIEQFKSV